jgi:CRP-like cAMP-binding protein
MPGLPPSEDPASLQAFLGTTSFFGGLESGTAAQIMAILKERRIAAGETLFEEGDTGKSMYIVRSGSLIVQRRGQDGAPCRLLMMRPGDFFGVTALIEMEPRPFSCLAERDSTLYELTNQDLYALYKRDPKTYTLVLQNIARELCRRLRKAAARIALLEDTLRAARPSAHETPH